MITCPQCGYGAAEESEFCERCGQGLKAAPPPAAALIPLTAGTELKGRYRIVELLSQSSDENRYRASNSSGDAGQRFQLRERLGPASPPLDTPSEGKAEERPQGEAASSGDPNGPRSKTRELRMPGQRLAAGAAEVEPVVTEVPAALTEALVDGAEEDSGSQQDQGTHPARQEAENARDGGDHKDSPGPAEDGTPNAAADSPEAPPDDLGELFGRVMGLSLTLDHPAFQCALEGFADNGRVYLVYPDEPLLPLSRREGGLRMSEREAIAVALQACQAIAVLNKRGLRLNDICPDSLAYASDGRIRIVSLDYVSNDNELQSSPILNDGYTAPEIYRGKGADKRADVFSVGCLLYSCLTGDRIPSESWHEEAGPVRFYPPHVVSPALEGVIRRALAFQPAERWPNADALKAELLRLNARVRVHSGALTDVGRVRELNEDSIMVVEYARNSQVEPLERSLYVVADGMGGAEAGETASALALGAIREHVEKTLTAEPGRPLSEVLQVALEEANRRVLEYQAVHPETRGMGSTAVGALISPLEAAVAWVGDSRAYLCNGGGLRQLTRDHSLVQRLIELGQLTPEQARHHEHKNVITRSLGARQSGPAGAEALSLRLKRGDRLVLCSDGLVVHVEDERIGQILRRHNDPFEAARELVVAANAGGGTDNVSVIVIFAD